MLLRKRYTYETLTANSCAVSDTFRLLELRFGLLKEKIEDTNWLDWYQRNQGNSIVEAYFGTKGNRLLSVSAIERALTN
jgi:CRISPR-associated protein Cmr2